MFLIRALINLWKNRASIKIVTWLATQINVLIFASGQPVILIESRINEVGMAWFIVVLFGGRTLFDYIQLSCNKKKQLIICIILTLCGICLGYVQWLPFSLDLVLACLPFFVTGFYLRKNIGVLAKNMLMFFCGIIWIVITVIIIVSDMPYLELAARRYSFFPISFITAICGSLFVIKICSLLQTNKKICKGIIYVGKRSMYIYFVHSIDTIWGFIWNVNKYNIAISIIIRMVLDIILGLLISVGLERIKEIKVSKRNKKV